MQDGAHLADSDAGFTFGAPLGLLSLLLLCFMQTPQGLCFEGRDVSTSYFGSEGRVSDVEMRET